MRRALRWTAAGVAVALLAGCASAPGDGAGESAAVEYHGTYIPQYGDDPDTAAPSLQAPSTAPPPAQKIPSTARRFAWTAERDALPVAFTLTVLTGLSVRKALATVAPHPYIRAGSVKRTERAVDRVLAKLDPDDQTSPRPQLVAAVRRGPYTLVLEDNNFLATDERVAGQLGARGAATVFFVNVNALSSYTVARDGRVVRSFDPLVANDTIGRPLPEERGLPFGGEQTYQWSDAMSLELTRRLTGYRVTATDFDMATYRLAVAVAP